jgi:hypothetical protein
MHTIAFTGPTKLSREQEEYVRREVGWVAANSDPVRYVSGAAFGVDTVAILAAWEAAHRKAEFYLTVPDRWHNESLVSFGREQGWTIEYVPGGYMPRNDRTVELADELHAFPETPVPVLRSGTWATIRRAERKGIPVHFLPLTHA